MRLGYTEVPRSRYRIYHADKLQCQKLIIRRSRINFRLNKKKNLTELLCNFSSEESKQISFNAIGLFNKCSHCYRYSDDAVNINLLSITVRSFQIYIAAKRTLIFSINLCRMEIYYTKSVHKRFFSVYYSFFFLNIARMYLLKKARDKSQAYVKKSNVCDDIKVLTCHR